MKFRNYNCSFESLISYSHLKGLLRHPSAILREETHHVTESHPTGSGKGFLIPLRQPTRGSDGEGFYITFLFKRDFVLKNLLRKLIYKGVTVLEWFIIFHLFEKDFKRRSHLENVLIFGMLNLSSNTRMGLDDWHFQIKSIQKLEIMTKKSKNLVQDEEISLLELVNSELTLPKSFTESYLSRKDVIPYFPPKEQRTIGVGYKDQGSKKPDHKWLPSVRVYSPPKPDLFDKVATFWKATLEVLSSE